MKAFFKTLPMFVLAVAGVYSLRTYEAAAQNMDLAAAQGDAPLLSQPSASALVLQQEQLLLDQYRYLPQTIAAILQHGAQTNLTLDNLLDDGDSTTAAAFDPLPTGMDTLTQESP